MSNLGQAALIVVGTVVGAYFGNPELGFALGGLAGSVLFPTQLPRGPQLTDNRTTTATIGEPIPIVFGTATVSGTVIWLAPYTQSSNEQGGKGGSEQQTYSYNQSIAIGLCEAPLDGGRAIGGLSRVWENGTIVYDVRPQQPADTATGALAETDEEYANRLAVSAAYAETFTLYLGDETQTADPTIEAVQGFGNVPAFRGLAYVVYPNRLLQTAQGWRHPNFQFEVFQSGTGNCTTTTKYSNSVLYPWIGDGSTDPTNPFNINTFYIAQVDPLAPNYSAPPSTAFATLEEAQAVTSAMYAQAFDVYIGYAISGAGGVINHMAQAGSTAFAGQYQTPDPGDLYLHFSWRTVPDGYTLALPGAGDSRMATEGAIFNDQGTLYATQGTFWIDYPKPPVQYTPAPTPPYTFAGSNRAYGYPNFWFTVEDVVIEVRRAPSAPRPPCEGLPVAPGLSGYCVLPSGQLLQASEWVVDDVNAYYVMQVAYIASGGDRTTYKATYPLNPVLKVSDPGNTETFWTAAYNAHVAEGSMPAGMTYSPGGGAGHYPTYQDAGASELIYSIDYTVCEGAGAEATIADIISAICQRAGLDAESIDVTDMAGITISGYAISSVSAGKDCIDPLRSVGFFDAVESGPILRFQSRGKPIVATLTTDDFGCYDDQGNDGSSQSNVPSALTVARADQTTLPRSIRFHYKSVTRDYQDAEQDSPYRLVTKSVNDQDISVPICLGDTQALQCAEILWADAWAGQTSYTLSVDQSMWALEPGDAIGVPVDNVIQRMRIISDSNSSGVLRKLNLVSDDGGAYISYAVAEKPMTPPQRLVILAATAAQLMDLPALQEADSDPGFYVAAEGIGSGNTWKGCVLYKSVDGGETYATLFSLVTPATVGTLADAVVPSEHFTWDDSTEILVNVASSAFTFESRTDDAVLAGANAAAMGADGRWEIIQFANAEQISSTQWKLTRLLRGRRGTEHNIPKSQAGDILVMVSTGDLNRVVLNSTEIGALRDYRATSIGASFSSGNVYPFTGRGMALTPFSPVDLQLTAQSDGDLLISWTRRDRLGGTLMSGVDMPLSEAMLAFQVDVLSPDSPDSPEVVIRTLSTSTTSVIYSSAQQASDFGSPLPGSVKVAVYQMSAVVGRGIPAIATLTLEGDSP